MKKRFFVMLSVICLLATMVLTLMPAAVAEEISIENKETADVPVIESQNPSNLKITMYVNSGECVLSVNAKGNGTLSYTWYVDGHQESCTDDKFVFDPLKHTPKSDGLPYDVYCKVTNTVGESVAEKASAAWAITVKHPVGPEITNSASASEITGNGTAKFTVEAKGEGLIYQWYLMDDTGGKNAVKNGVSGSFEYSGATTKTLSVKCVDVMNSVANSYICEVTSQSGITSTTEVYILYANPDPAIDKVQSLKVSKLPSVTSYKAGDKLDTSGLVVDVTTGRGTESITSGFVCTPTYLNDVGKTTITVSYGGKTTTFTVSVEQGEHAHKWSSWEKDSDLKTVERHCTVDGCDVKERYTFSEFEKQFPNDAKTLGIVTTADVDNGKDDDKEDPEGTSGNNAQPDSGDKESNSSSAGEVDNDVNNVSNDQDGVVKTTDGVNSSFLWLIIIIAFLVLVGAGCYYFLVYKKPDGKAKDRTSGEQRRVSVRKKDGNSERKR